MKSRSCTELLQEVQLHVAARSQLPGRTPRTVVAKDPAEGAQLLAVSIGSPRAGWKIMEYP